MAQQPKEKRRGGVQDDSEIYINYTRKQLMGLMRRIKIGIRKQQSTTRKK
jgi:hypothetical protein